MAAAAAIRERIPVILPRVVADACAGDASEAATLDLQKRLTVFLERRIPTWLEALEAEDGHRRDLALRLLQIDRVAGEQIPPVVLLGTIAIGFRVMEAAIRSEPLAYDYPVDDLCAEVDLLRRTVLDMRRDIADGGGRVA